MKKKYFIIPITILLMFMFNIRVLASDVKISCASDAKVDEPFECDITTDKKVTINYDGLILHEGSDTMNSSGSIKFRANKAKKYYITLTYLDENSNEAVTTEPVIVSENVTTTKKTTTTTTTKKTTSAKSSNNYLKSIIIDGEDLTDFSKEKNRYEYNVPNKTTKVNIEALVDDASSTVKIDGPKTLSVGDNTYTISVTSEDNTTKYYKVIVSRDEEISNNTKIDSINIKGYNLKMDGSSKTYYLDVKKGTESLDINVTLNDEKASFNIEGNDNLSNGSIIKIIVTAQNKDTSTYRIIINMPEEKSNTLLIVIIVIIILLIIGGIGTFLIIKKKKNNKNKKNKPDSKNSNERKKEELEEYDDVNSEDEDIDDEVDSDELEKTKILTYDNYDDETTKTINFEDFNF